MTQAMGGLLYWLPLQDICDMEIGAGVFPLAEGLQTRWRPLYDDYGPVRPGPLRRSAVPSPEPPTTPAIVRLVGIAVTVFPVPADFDGGLDAMIQPVAEVLYVNQAMGEPLYEKCVRFRAVRVLQLRA